jgi:hypothetical protein
MKTSQCRDLVYQANLLCSQLSILYIDRKRLGKKINYTTFKRLLRKANYRFDRRLEHYRKAVYNEN